MPDESIFMQQIRAGKPLLSDGAMGTVLHARGVDFDQCFDDLNLTNPGLIAEIHREYIEAGSDILQTNTFGANRYKLMKSGLEGRVAEINKAAVELARRSVMASYKNILIAGDIGPLGVRLAPYGRVQAEQARSVFMEQADALFQAGVDLIIVETFSDLAELREAIQAIRQLSPDIPIVASMTYTRDDRTVLGDNPAKVAKTLFAAGADVAGANCSGGPAQLMRILKVMRIAVPGGRFSVMPNAGWPEQVGGRVMYPAGPEYFGDYAAAFLREGAVLLGGCCGTTPKHISAMRRAMDTFEEHPDRVSISSAVAAEEEKPAEGEQPTLFAQKVAAGKFVIAVEMDPPRGLATQKLLAGASMLAEAGADAINVADSPMARMRMSPWAVCDLIQRKTQIDTILHFPTRGRNMLRVQGDLLAAHALGVRNVFVVMGDPTAIGDYPEAMDNYDLVPSGLIKLIKQGFNTGVDQAGTDIGQPTSFFVGCALNLAAADVDHEIKNLQRKLNAGADFILTQPVFNPENLDKFLLRYELLHGELKIPILVGILPLNNPRHAAFLHHEVPGIEIPQATQDRLAQAGEHPQKVGVEIAVELAQQMKPHVQGVYISPAFGRYDLAAEIVEALA
jgi:homocysteine S-methyltransferase